MAGLFLVICQGFHLPNVPETARRAGCGCGGVGGESDVARADGGIIA